MHSRFQASMRYIWRYKYLYLLLLPAVLYFLIFHYLPMYGVIISFKDFNFKKDGVKSQLLDDLVHHTPRGGKEVYQNAATWEIGRAHV